MNMRFIVLALVMAFAAFPASAKEWVVDYKSSKLAFTGTQSGTPFTGTFANYIAKIDLDLRKPEQGKIDVQIDVRSANTGDTQRDGMLPNPEWFDSKNIPFSEFVSTEIKEVGEHRYEAKGLLKMKLTTKEVTLPFTLEKYNDGMRAKGQLVVNRADYAIGTGEWVSDKFVGFPVTITLDLVAYQP